MSMWWWLDRASAQKINSKIQRGLFQFAVSSSCVNPIVYGMCTRTVSQMFRKQRCLVGRRRSTGTSESRAFMIADHATNEQLTAARVCLVNGLLLTPCAVAVRTSRVFWHRWSFHGRHPVTPPHISRHRVDNASTSV
ncbi:hypothetical protein NP493_1783g00002 [Ridgeia piscesae]|uniref:Uncharacterized protein n=1 Tax=Ridgeia piscesae TaxID=27915 RepID=A0AAD9JSH8_RIDPI|nr:hypothetical protein NP493_1783g00002 [Ridgeia piscesae]